MPAGAVRSVASTQVRIRLSCAGNKLTFLWLALLIPVKTLQVYSVHVDLLHQIARRAVLQRYMGLCDTCKDTF